MNEQELGHRIVTLTATLYRVSCGLLRSEADREDAVQAAIEKAWVKAHSLRDEGRLKPWLVRILINECYSLLRRKGRVATRLRRREGAFFAGVRLAFQKGHVSRSGTNSMIVPSGMGSQGSPSKALPCFVQISAGLLRRGSTST